MTTICLLFPVAIVVYKFVLETLVLSPLAKIPGPKLWVLSSARLALEDWRGKRTTSINKLHKQYGPVVRVGPREVSFNSTTAVRTIYGAGSSFEKPTFYYGIFDVYGEPNLFSLKGVKPHGERRKLLAHSYAKGSILKGDVAAMVEGKVEAYLQLLEQQSAGAKPVETFTTLHYFSLDTISNFIFGPDFGGTSCLVGAKGHRALLDDIFDPARRKLIWCLMHFPSITTWMYTRTKLMESLLDPFLPMKKPATFTGVRVHCKASWDQFKAASDEKKMSHATANSILGRLWKYHKSNHGADGLSDMDIASECADEFLAGVDTTADSLMFLLWALSQPKNLKFQERLREEVQSLPQEQLNANGIPKVEAADKLPFLNAVIKETLRMYAPIPASEPRSNRSDSLIDGYQIPAGTIVGVGPYYLHRRTDIFASPEEFDPERWLVIETSLASNDGQVMEMKRAFWPFASGARMCIGMHLAMAEMTTLVSAIYRRYETGIPEFFEGVTPGITSRFELFYEESYKKIAEHACYIEFKKLVA